MKSWCGGDQLLPDRVNNTNSMGWLSLRQLYVFLYSPPPPPPRAQWSLFSRPAVPSVGLMCTVKPTDTFLGVHCPPTLCRKWMGTGGTLTPKHIWLATEDLIGVGDYNDIPCFSDCSILTHPFSPQYFHWSFFSPPLGLPQCTWLRLMQHLLCGCVHHPESEFQRCLCAQKGWGVLFYVLSSCAVYRK